MREIKFRAKSIETGEWVYGFYYHAQISDQHFIVKEKNEGMAQFFRVDSKTLGQFTGLKDKNGKEIYEGDILNVFAESTDLDHTDELAYRIEIEDIRDLPVGLDNCEVIGNIYENPELLK